MSSVVSKLVVVVGAPRTLGQAGRNLQREGIRLHRIPVIRYQPTPKSAIQAALNRYGLFDTLIFTSRQSVSAFLGRPQLTALRPRRLEVEVIAVGPGTAAALRHLGIQPDWMPDRANSTAIVAHLSVSTPRRVAYPRSDRAGPRLARVLRRSGHTVLDLVAYRVLPPRSLPKAADRWLESASRVVITSPSALSHLRDAIRPGTFQALRRAGTLIVLGERSARAARGHGFRGARIAPKLSTNGLTRFLKAELHDAS